jgi:cysteine synthase
MSRAVAERANLPTALDLARTLGPENRIPTVLVDSGLEYLSGTAYA